MKATLREVDAKLATTMISFIPDYVWNNPESTFLDISMQTGSLIVCVVEKLKSLGYSYENIQRRVFGFAEDPFILAYAVKHYGLIGTFGVVDALKCNIDKTLGISFNINNKNYCMKFDVVIGNPPYLDGLHLSFLDKAVDIAKKHVLFIEPASWLISEKTYKHNTKEEKLKEKIQSSVESIDILNPNLYFKDAKLATPVAIILLNKDKSDSIFTSRDFMRGKTFTYNHIDEISKWGNDKEYLMLKSKIKSFVKINGCLLDHRNDKGNFYVNFALIRGNIAYSDKNMFSISDFFTFVPSDLKIEKEMNKGFGIGFNNKANAENLLAFVKTKFARFCLSILKTNANLNRGELKLVPWLDFTQEWTDEKLYKHFNLTKEEINFIETNIPKYY